MNKLVILVGFTLNFSLLFSQECNKNVFSEDEAMKLSAYGKNLEKAILDKNPGDTARIAKLQGDFSKDLCGYSDDEVIKISNYLKELEKIDSTNKVVPVVEVPVEPVVETPKPVESTTTTTTSSSSKPAEIVFFSPNSSQLKVAKMAEFVGKLKADPTLTINISGYADADASDEYNLALSKRRAKAVRDYLISRGIAPSRITNVEAFGEQNPIADNSTPEGKAQNRRVEISVK